ncbi:hypothetical protein HA466_0153850 [Hirschfeldia incana]|nr:hypothetical protein HA466_0153850 [Hirschfeldia incana]KAJ0248256.1 hypothetical protein HA466_0153850 [Hirschfeldia incana]KAJ0248257.1 hypothetical protein HA466_0153850 [Hirschfeldia incana]KAJ0248258.1 hypothetical protein HA466_0153850 [Hirschfeldia incana]KAJ0248259.1 hypothetical protein HA466_0153850 [Hirschfeldia incana]
MAEAAPALRKHVFTKVNELRPGANGHSLNVKVVSTKMVMQRGDGGRPSGPQARQMRIAECLVGDETGIIILTARNDQELIFENGRREEGWLLCGREGEHSFYRRWPPLVLTENIVSNNCNKVLLGNKCCITCQHQTFTYLH